MNNSKEVERVVAFCVNCGQVLFEHCPNCEGSNEIYCEYCGTKITDDNVKTFEQKHDEGRSEILVSGYKCSACGADIDF